MAPVGKTVCSAAASGASAAGASLLFHYGTEPAIPVQGGPDWDVAHETQRAPARYHTRQAEVRQIETQAAQAVVNRPTCQLRSSRPAV